VRAVKHSSTPNPKTVNSFFALKIKVIDRERKRKEKNHLIERRLKKRSTLRLMARGSHCFFEDSSPVAEIVVFSGRKLILSTS